MNLSDFNKRIVRPMVLSGIKRGDYDAVIGECLEDHQSGTFTFSSDIVAAMVARVPFVLAKKPWWEQAPGRIGTNLRIKLPADWSVL